MHIMVGRVLIFLFLLMLTLIAIAMISVLSAERGEVRRLPRGAWVAIILLLPVVGAALYLWLGRPIRRREPRAATAIPPRPLAPDDDPEFLRRLGSITPPKPSTPERPATVDPRTPEDSRTMDDRPPTDG